MNTIQCPACFYNGGVDFFGPTLMGSYACPRCGHFFSDDDAKEECSNQLTEDDDEEIWE